MGGASSLPAHPGPTSRPAPSPSCSATRLKDATRRLWALLLEQNTQPNMGLFSLNGSFLQIFLPLNAATAGALIIIKLFIDKFDLSMLPFELSAADAPFVTMTAYVPLVMVTNLATVFYVLLGEGGSYNNSDSRAQKAGFTGLKARVSATARFACSLDEASTNCMRRWWRRTKTLSRAWASCFRASSSRHPRASTPACSPSCVC